MGLILDSDVDVDNADLSAAGEVGVLEPRLAAVFSSGAGGGEKMNSGVLTRRRQQTSPHTLMGAGESLQCR